MRQSWLATTCVAFLLSLSCAASAEPAGMEKMQHVYGQWGGALQYVLFTLDKEFAGQGEGAETQITIDSAGAITGSAREVGCKLSGQITRGWLFARADVEMRLRGCKRPVFNTVFTGYIYANDRRKNAVLRLESKTTDTDGYPMTVYVTGKMEKLYRP